MKQQEIQQRINELQSDILSLKAKLKNYDYIGIKIAMGVATKSDYHSEIAETENWRHQINQAEDEIASLTELEPDPEEDGEEH